MWDTAHACRGFGRGDLPLPTGAYHPEKKKALSKMGLRLRLAQRRPHEIRTNRRDIVRKIYIKSSDFKSLRIVAKILRTTDSIATCRVKSFVANWLRPKTHNADLSAQQGNRRIAFCCFPALSITYERFCPDICPNAPPRPYSLDFRLPRYLADLT